MAVLEALQSAGLNKTEARVYLALLKAGSISGSEIAEKAGIFRRNAYDALESLAKKGLASVVIKDKKYYSPAAPSKLMELLEEKKQFIEGSMPELEELFSKPKAKQKVYLFEGIEGFKNILGEILKDRKDWLAFVSSGYSTRVLDKKFVDYWERKRAMAGIKAKWIVANTTLGIKRARDAKKSGLLECRILPLSTENPVSTYVFGNKTAMILWSKINPLAVMVESPEIAEANKKYFEFLWKQAKKY